MLRKYFKVEDIGHGRRSFKDADGGVFKGQLTAFDLRDHEGRYLVVKQPSASRYNSTLASLEITGEFIQNSQGQSLEAENFAVGQWLEIRDEDPRFMPRW